MASRYVVPRIEQRLHLDTLYDAAMWETIPSLELAAFPWYRSGTCHRTRARLVHDGERIIAEFVCEDTHISSRIIDLNGAVWNDSCVELFLRPDPARDRHYFNIEINACGTLLMAWGADRNTRAYIDFDDAKDIKIFHSVSGMLKNESPHDTSWRIVAPLPLSVFRRLSGLPLAIESGTRWTGNFYRCGGITNPQFACWSPIDHPVPDFHRPEYFGELEFG